MVIANSDSTSTLVSLNDNVKHGGVSTDSLLVTSPSLRIPLDIGGPTAEQPYAYCPTEDLLESHAIGCQELWNQGVVHYDTSSEERVVYVSQGEVAHATSQQCDVMLSDQATTCHILLLRSVSEEPLVTCMHIDGTHYDDCIRQAVQQHVDFHDPTNIEVHIAGGFDNEISRKLSQWLLQLLADISQQVLLTLQTCAISTWNDQDGYPRARGLAVNVHTGRVTMATTSIPTPLRIQRLARLWCDTHRTLAVVHTPTCHHLTIPALVHPVPHPALLKLPDHLLLHYTSTSPHCEDANFCETVRQTLQMLQAGPVPACQLQRRGHDWQVVA